jgi:hypothetical protein
MYMAMSPVECDQLSEVEEERGVKEEENSVILDLNPEKYEKPKDYLFFDFFSLYARNSISQKKPSSRPAAGM